MVEIREVTSADADAVCRIVHASFEELRRVLDPPSSAHELVPETVLKNLATSKGFFAMHEGEPVGVVFCRPDDDHMYLYRLGVLPEHRKRGFAKSLIDQVEAEALGLGIPEVQLATRTTLKQNIGYYAKLGYEDIGEWPHPRKPTTMITVMRKRLLPNESGTESKVKPHLL